MAVITWEQAGRGPLPLSLVDAQHLALAAGFVFPGAAEDLPLARRANLHGGGGDGQGGRRLAHT